VISAVGIPFLIQGAPAHALIVHATVVLLPLTSLALLLCAFSARLRRRVGVLLPVAGIGCLILVPITTYTGGQLEHHVYLTPQVLAHVRAADGLLPWAIGLAVMSLIVYVGQLVTDRRRPRSVGAAATGARAGAGRGWPARSARSIGAAVLATTVVAGTLVEVVHIGHLGAQAVWSGIGNQPYHSIPKGDPQ
jgi:hypothetical protein